MLKAVLVRELVGTPVSLTASVVMAERLTDVAGLVALGALGVTVLPRGPLLLGGIALVLLVAAVVALRTPAIGRQARRLLPGRLVEPVAARSSTAGARSCRPARWRWPSAFPSSRGSSSAWRSR